MDTYLMLNGTKYELSLDLVQAMMLEVERKQPVKQNPFEQVPYEEQYYYVNGVGEVLAPYHLDSELDKERYYAANYCTDKSLMEQRALHETLNRLLWRYSEEHGGDSEWDGNTWHYTIARDANGELGVSHWIRSYTQGAVYFRSTEIAMSAIQEIVVPFLADHPNFRW